jgi:hypothetical protein
MSRQALARFALCSALPLYLATGHGGAPQTWEEVARFHFARYPAMEAADLYKLVAQGVSGNRHLLADPAGAWRYLERELAATEAGEGPLCEPLSPGGAVLRVHLAPFKARGLSAEGLFAAMLETTREINGGALEFAAAWRRMVGLAGSNRIPLATDGLARLAAVPFDPLAWTRHSAAFERLYRPHYRVVARRAFSRHFPGTNPDE